MRLPGLLVLLLITVLGSVLWLAHLDTTCRVPVYYHIGTVDPHFGISTTSFQERIHAAESVWENPLHRELFVEDNRSESLPVNLIFDERQEKTDLESRLRDDLKKKRGLSEDVAAQYASLVTQFQKLQDEYDAASTAYNQTLTDYNHDVTEWNNKGGAPEDVLAQLHTRESDLKKQQVELQKRADALNVLVKELNKVGSQGNSLITDYNTIVKQYNSQVKGTREFAQGEYIHGTSTAINIYEFTSDNDLTLVLAHELGHALSLQHVENPTSIMYMLMGKQSLANGLTTEDITAFHSTCASVDPLTRAGRTLKELLNR